MTETFPAYMENFLKSLGHPTVVEIGSDSQMLLAWQLAPVCKEYISLNFKSECERMETWHDLGSDTNNIYNVRLVEGNALELSKVVNHADVIILHYVGLYLNENAWKSEDGHRWPGAENAEEIAYGEFKKVARHVVRFDNPKSKSHVEELLKKINIEKAEFLELQDFRFEEPHVGIACMIDNA